MYAFPIPNDKIDGRVVVASCPYIDDDRGEVALVLLLERQPPFFTVAHYALTDFDPTRGLYGDPEAPQRYGPSYDAGEIDIIGRFSNIVPAVDEYQDSGGGY